MATQGSVVATEENPDRTTSAWEEAASLARSGNGSKEATMLTWALLAIASTISKLQVFKDETLKSTGQRPDPRALEEMRDACP